MGKRIELFATFNRGLPVILLGRADFFDRFRVLFDERAKIMTISEYESDTNDAEPSDRDSSAA